uniref:ParG n=1 Tax=Escherichia coli TaxID=562 RepID=W5XIR4_ECOLX|nr:ParG [Escherichia coli]AMQ12890.1 ParG [Escherichia coli]AWH59331.1 ParG [Escherichia coli]QQZ45590.1 ParG [Escherichia coli]QQZ45634.1 ParG [Escherichia coli]
MLSNAANAALRTVVLFCPVLTASASRMDSNPSDRRKLTSLPFLDAGLLFAPEIKRAVSAFVAAPSVSGNFGRLSLRVIFIAPGYLFPISLIALRCKDNVKQQLFLYDA